MPIEAFRFLTNLTTPQMLEEVIDSEIRNKLEADVLTNLPNIDMSVPQPFAVMLDTDTAYIANDRRYQNILRLETLTLFASGADLDQRGAEHLILRNPGEIDDVYRDRIAAAVYTSTATYPGLEAAVFRDTVLSQLVNSITFEYVPVTGVSMFTVLARPDSDGSVVSQPPGTPTAQLIADVLEFLSSPSIAPAGASFSHRAPTITQAYLALSVQIPAGETLEQVTTAIRDALTVYQTRNFSLGNSIRQQDLYAAIPTRYIANITRLTTDPLETTQVTEITTPNRHTAFYLVPDEIAVN